MSAGRKSPRIAPFFAAIVAVASIVAGSMAASLALSSCSPRKDDGYRFLIGVSLANLSEPWRIAMYREIESESASLDNVRFIYTDSGDSVEKQELDVDRLLECGVDLLIMSPVDSVRLAPVARKVYARVPLILIDRAVDGYDYTLFIGPDNRQIGLEAGRLVRDMLPASGGSVIELQGRRDSLPAVERSAGFREALSGANGARIVSLNGNWLRDSAQDALGANLDPRNPPDIVFAHNDAMANGAVRALRGAYGESYRVDSHGVAAGKARIGTRVVGVDGFSGTDGGLDMVEKGTIDATFLCPTGGKEAVRFSMDILAKAEGIPKKIILRSRRVTKDNVREILDQKPRQNRRPNGAILFGFAQTGRESDWREANTASIKNAAKDFGIQLAFKDANLDQANQIAAIREFIRMRVDVIAFSPLVETGWDEVLAEAKAAGIPVICSDRTVKTNDDALFSTFIGGDFAEEGRRAARWLLDATAVRAASGSPSGGAPASDNSAVSGKKDLRIFELRGTEDSGPAIERKKGFEEALVARPDARIVRSEMGDFKRSEGYRITKELLAKDGLFFDAIFSHNDDMALGAIQALEEAGYKPGSQVIIVSIDAVHAAFKAMAEGKLNCTVECNPLLGPQLMKAVRDYMDGKDLPLRIITDEKVFPASSAKKDMAGRKY